MFATITTETIESLVSVRAELKALKAREEAQPICSSPSIKRR